MYPPQRVPRLIFPDAVELGALAPHLCRVQRAGAEWAPAGREDPGQLHGAGVDQQLRAPRQLLVEVEDPQGIGRRHLERADRVAAALLRAQMIGERLLAVRLQGSEDRARVLVPLHPLRQAVLHQQVPLRPGIAIRQFEGHRHRASGRGHRLQPALEGEPAPLAPSHEVADQRQRGQHPRHRVQLADVEEGRNNEDERRGNGDGGEFHSTTRLR